MFRYEQAHHSSLLSSIPSAHSAALASCWIPKKLISPFDLHNLITTKTAYALYTCSMPSITADSLQSSRCLPSWRTFFKLSHNAEQLWVRVHSIPLYPSPWNNIRSSNSLLFIQNATLNHYISWAFKYLALYLLTIRTSHSHFRCDRERVPTFRYNYNNNTL